MPTRRQGQGPQVTERISQYTEGRRSAISTINDLPDELLVEIFDFYRQDNADSYQSWSIKLGWFKLIHVCKRWSTVMLASSSRLNLCLVLEPKKGGNIKTILSRRFRQFDLPIYINYIYQQVQHGAMTAKDMSRMLAALRRPDRIRGITFTGSAADMDKFLKAIKCPLPALESLELRIFRRNYELKVPATFLKSNQNLRSLKLGPISLPSISRLLSPAPALTYLSLVIGTHFGPVPVTSLLLSYLQGMPCLRHLDLSIDDFNVRVDDQVQLTKPKEIFPLSKLTYFHYVGHSAFLNNLVAGISAPSLQDVKIVFQDEVSPGPALMYPSQFIKDIVEHYHAVQVFFNTLNFSLALLASSGYDLPRFRLFSGIFPELMMEMLSTFSTKLITTEELFIIFLCCNPILSDKNVPWRMFLLQFPSVKALRMEVTDSLNIASALNQDHEEPDLSLLPALEEIELCIPPDYIMNPEDQHPSGPEAFQPFVSARERAGRPVRVFWGPPSGISRRRLKGDQIRQAGATEV